jgi:hypothetical protein
MASPLLLSTDLAKLTPAELSIVSNKDIVAVDQDPLGAQGTIVQSGAGYDVLAKPLANGDVAAVLFNRGDTARTFTTTASALGLPSGAPYQLTDLVSKQKTVSDGIISASLAPHATVIYRIHPGGNPNLPPSTAASVKGGPFTAGKAVPVKVTLTDNGYTDVRQGKVSLGLPAGWSATPASVALGTIAPGQHATATFEVTSTAPAPGIVTNTVSANVDYRAGGLMQSTSAGLSVVTNTPFPTLAAAFNNVAVTDESAPGPGNFDGNGDSYSAQALAAAGVTPGSTVTVNGASFTWPAAAAGTADNVEGDGVLVDLSGSGSKLAFLGSEAGFDDSAVTVTYTDGTTSSSSLGFPNWCCAPTNAYGATPAVVTTNRDTPTGPANYGTDYDVFYNAIPLDAGKTVATVTLPSDPALHIFALAIQQ